MGDAGLVETALGHDAGALDLLGRGDLGFAQRLDAGDFELLGRAAALEPRRIERPFAVDVGGLDIARCRDLGLPHARIGLDALGAPRRNFDDARLLGLLDGALARDVDDLALLLRADAALFEQRVRPRSAAARPPPGA